MLDLLRHVDVGSGVLLARRVLLVGLGDERRNLGVSLAADLEEEQDLATVLHLNDLEKTKRKMKVISPEHKNRACFS